MKTLWIKPGFEFIFSISLIAIICLPPLVFAQGTKDMEIRITNGDTVVNGKNIKDLSQTDHTQALKDIQNLGSSFTPGQIDHQRMIVRKRGTSDTGANKIIIERRRFERGNPNNEMAEQFRSPKDSAERFFKFRMQRRGDKDSTFTFNYKMNNDPENRFDERDRNFNFSSREPGRDFMRHRNTQTFNYTNTGSDGISTRTSFRVTEPSPEKLKEMGGNEKNELEIKDMNLIPEFSSGKTTLMFSLPSQAIAEVKFTDNEGKVLWSAKAANGNFNKSFPLGLNGLYFLQVKQAGKIAVKRIIKEE
ncbi:MAG: type sorting protein [Mucilaginibacter sp.]|nr:type sorting protein [Mucilaginibacter sp.]